MKNLLIHRASDKRRLITNIYILLMLFIFPLYTGFSGYTDITFSKYTFFVGATLLWLVGLVALSIIRKDMPKIPRIALIPGLAFVLAVLLSLLFSSYKTQALIGAGRYDGLVTLLLYAAIFLGISTFGALRKEYLYVFSASALICCIVAVLQIFRIDILFLFPQDTTYYDAHIRYTGEFLGTIGNTNLLSAMLCLAIPVTFVFPIISGKRHDCLLYIPLFFCVFTLAFSGVAGGAFALSVCALIAAPIFISSSKRLIWSLPPVAISFLAIALAQLLKTGNNALMVCACCCLAIALFVFHKYWHRKAVYSKKLRVIVICLIVVFIFAALAYVYLSPVQSGTVYEFSQVLHGNISDKFGSSRIEIWRKSLALVPEYPIFGSGPDTLALRLDLTFSRYDEATGKTFTTFVDNAHNEYLGHLVNLGVFGLACYLAILFSALYVSAKNTSNGLLLVISVAVLCYCVQSFFGLGLCIVAPLLWIFLGLIMSVNNTYSVEVT